MRFEEHVLNSGWRATLQLREACCMTPRRLFRFVSCEDQTPVVSALQSSTAAWARANVPGESRCSSRNLLLRLESCELRFKAVRLRHLRSESRCITRGVPGCATIVRSLSRQPVGARYMWCPYRCTCIRAKLHEGRVATSCLASVSPHRR
jgi:hypothetical protein